MPLELLTKLQNIIQCLGLQCDCANKVGNVSFFNFGVSHREILIMVLSLHCVVGIFKML